jgi:hypothetical protein
MSKPNNEPLAEDILRLVDSLADDNATNDDELRRQLREGGIDPVRAEGPVSSLRHPNRDTGTSRKSTCASRSPASD